MTDLRILRLRHALHEDMAYRSYHNYPTYHRTHRGGEGDLGYNPRMPDSLPPPRGFGWPGRWAYQVPIPLQWSYHNPIPIPTRPVSRPRNYHE